MCRLDTTPKLGKRRSSSLLLLTHDSFLIPNPVNKDDENKHIQADANKNPLIHGLGGPSLLPTLLTVSFYLAILFIIEHATRLFIAQYSSLDPLLENEKNRHILARHIAVDFFPLAFCVYIAITNRHACREIIDHGMSFYNKTESNLMTEDGFEERVFGYHPGSQRLLTMFFVYQVKNMYDTIVWGDGIEFVLHHVFAGSAAWGGLYPGGCHFYALFYFGFSEVSTAILCLLANFDPEFGVMGLERLFPKTKMVLGALFVASFVLCRLIAWPFTTYYYFRDTLQALRSDVPRVKGRRVFLMWLNCCCAGLTLIQLVFVAMIVKIGKQEVQQFFHPEL